jgi:hypothetical protein
LYNRGVSHSGICNRDPRDVELSADDRRAAYRQRYLPRLNDHLLRSRLLR